MLHLIFKKNIWIPLVLFIFVLSACAGQATTQAVPTATQATMQEPTSVPDEPTVTVEQPTATVEQSTAMVEEPAATEATAGMEISFANDVLPVLENSCLKCHGGEKTTEGFDVSSYETVMAGADDGVVIVAGDADGSKLFTLINTGKMPKKANKLPDAQIQLIRDWINAGALDN